MGAVASPAKIWGAYRMINKLFFSKEWRGQSNHIIIHAVHANGALSLSKP